MVSDDLILAERTHLLVGYVVGTRIWVDIVQSLFLLRRLDVEIWCFKNSVIYFFHIFLIVYFVLIFVLSLVISVFLVLLILFRTCKGMSVWIPIFKADRLFWFFLLWFISKLSFNITNWRISLVLKFRMRLDLMLILSWFMNLLWFLLIVKVSCFNFISFLLVFHIGVDIVAVFIRILFRMRLISFLFFDIQVILKYFSFLFVSISFTYFNLINAVEYSVVGCQFIILITNCFCCCLSLHYFCIGQCFRNRISFNSIRFFWDVLYRIRFFFDFFLLLSFFFGIGWRNGGFKFVY